MTTSSPPQSPSLPGQSAVSDPARFEPVEEAALLVESNAQKASANKLFALAQYSQAIGEYDKALSLCPNYFEYEIAVLRSNVAACHLKLEDWKAAVDSATTALEALERLAPKKDLKKEGTETGNDAVVEISAGDEKSEAAQLKNLEITDKRKEDIERIRCKSLLRRAKAKNALGGWANLQNAEDDYKAVSAIPNLPSSDRKVVDAALRDLPSRVKSAKDKEVGEMMGKLKELGNGILKPFGMSTDNFNMVKDEKTGGYSLNFNQNR